MDHDDWNDRLSRIVTQWSLVLQAHDRSEAADADEGSQARGKLLLRYSGAIYRYLLGATRDPDAAADLAQEFAVRFVRGDFHRASPDRGRFRQYLKTALIRMVTDHHRAKKRGPQELHPDSPEPAAPAEEAGGEQDLAYRASWQAEFLDKTWRALEEAHPMQHAALRLRIAGPDLSSAQMAEELTRQLGKEVNAALVRKSLERGHAKFAELLVEEVAHSLADPSPAALEEELAELDLLKYCRSVVERRKERGPA